LKGIVFDLDGTLYRQATLRRFMLCRLVQAHLLRPITGVRTARALGAYRQAQEKLRAQSTFAQPSTDLAELQIELTCQRTHAPRHFVAEIVARWMENEPLAVLPNCIQPGLVDFLNACRSRGLRLGVLSDYPAEAKIAALGLHGLFDVVLSAQSPDVGIFKPNPRGLLRAAVQLGASPSECAYVGDRAEVDGPAAAAAGMTCFILTPHSCAHASATWIPVAGFAQLNARLNHPSTAAEQAMQPAVPTI
jgi:putative hydrolase of the HAD superfamily